LNIESRVGVILAMYGIIPPGKGYSLIGGNCVMDDLIIRYNYDAFVPEKFQPWMRFDSSPPLGQRAPDFPLWKLKDRSETRLSEVWSTHKYTVVEFGSFT
jgi:hypothetical protein